MKRKFRKLCVWFLTACMVLNFTALPVSAEEGNSEIPVGVVEDSETEFDEENKVENDDAEGVEEDSEVLSEEDEEESLDDEKESAKEDLPDNEETETSEITDIEEDLENSEKVLKDKELLPEEDIEISEEALERQRLSGWNESGKETADDVSSEEDEDILGATGDVAISTTNFPDSVFRNYVSKEFDSNKDGILSKSEIASATDIYLFAKTVYDMKGIEYFTSLNYLDCGGNHLTSLDVTKNTKLYSLLCDGNKLTTLDVSKNTQLQSLWLNGNSITTIDISNCPYLISGLKEWTKLDRGTYYIWKESETSDIQHFGCDKTVKIITDIFPSNIVLNKTSATMYYGDSLTLTAKLSPSNVTAKTISWSISNPSIASVNGGVVKVWGAGKVNVTAKTVNGLSATCVITILAENNSSNPFADVKSGGWEYTAAKYVYDKKYMTGKGELIPGKVIFSPNTPINRSQFVQTLYNMDGKPSVTYKAKFSDVKSTDWFAKPVTWAEKNGIAAGNADGTFGVDGKATREQLAVMLYKYAKYKKYNTSVVSGKGKRVNDFPDKGEVSSWSKDALNWALSRGIISGKGSGNLDPKGSATRVECATMVRNFMKAYGK